MSGLESLSSIFSDPLYHFAATEDAHLTNLLLAGDWMAPPSPPASESDVGFAAGDVPSSDIQRIVDDLQKWMTQQNHAEVGQQQPAAVTRRGLPTPPTSPFRFSGEVVLNGEPRFQPEEPSQAPWQLPVRAGGLIELETEIDDEETLKISSLDEWSVLPPHKSRDPLRCDEDLDFGFWQDGFHDALLAAIETNEGSLEHALCDLVQAQPDVLAEWRDRVFCLASYTDGLGLYAVFLPAGGQLLFMRMRVSTRRLWWGGVVETALGLAATGLEECFARAAMDAAHLQVPGLKTITFVVETPPGEPLDPDVDHI